MQIFTGKDDARMMLHAVIIGFGILAAAVIMSSFFGFGS
jgi:hypothetical protein